MSLIDEAAIGGDLRPASTSAEPTFLHGHRPLVLALMELINDFAELSVRKLFGQGHKSRPERPLSNSLRVGSALHVVAGYARPSHGGCPNWRR
jgi:hypothetical protein